MDLAMFGDDDPKPKEAPQPQPSAEEAPRENREKSDDQEEYKFTDWALI